MLEKGMKSTRETLVTPENTAKKYGSGDLEVFATPAMIALMEETCLKMVAPELDENSGTVGSSVNVVHLVPSIIGNTIRCDAELVDIDGRRLVFEVVCRDGDKEIGKGTHERFIINNELFMTKARKNAQG